MMVLITYDVNTMNGPGRRRLRRVAKACENYGQRVQNSVFECMLEPAQWTALRKRLVDEIDEEVDSLRFYFLGKNWRTKIEHAGAKPAYDPEGPLIL